MASSAAVAAVAASRNREWCASPLAPQDQRMHRVNSDLDDAIRKTSGGLPAELGDGAHPATLSAEELHHSFGIGRCGGVKIGYVLAKPKPAMTMVPAGVNAKSILMDPRRSLIDQYDALGEREKPDIIILKCHEFFMKAERGEYLRNIDAFIERDKKAYRGLRILSYRIQRLLADRFSMSAVLDDACGTANRARLGKYAVPFAKNLSAGLPPDATETAAFPYPLVVKPRDSSKHDTMCVVFDAAGLRHAAAWLGCDYRLEQFVNHGGWVHKVYAVGRELRIGRRPSLSDMHVHSPADLQRVAAELECQAVLLPSRTAEAGARSEQGQPSPASPVAAPSSTTAQLPPPSAIGGYLVFDSAKLTKGRSTGIPVCITLEESELDSEKVRTISKVFRGILQCGLFGFDILHDAATDTYYVVDVNLFPGYKGFAGFHEVYHTHLRQQAVVKAVAKDSEKLLQHDLIKRICAAAVPAWRDDAALDGDPVAGLSVRHIKSHNNNIFCVSRAGSHLAADSVIYRVGGQRFRRRPWREMELLAWLRRVHLGTEVITPLVPEYFGDTYPLGRIEQCLPGRALGQYTLAAVDTTPATATNVDTDGGGGGGGGSGGATAATGGALSPASSSSASACLSSASASSSSVAMMPSNVLQPRFYLAITAEIGASLARMHHMAADAEFQNRYLKLHYADWKDSILWRRLESWKLLSIVHWEAAAGQLEHHPVWRPLFADVTNIMLTLPRVIAHARSRLRCAYSSRTVFAHFDLTPNNVLITPRASGTVDKVADFAPLQPADMRVHLVDFEWSGPCAAVYDFAKFFLSTQMSVLTKFMKRRKEERKQQQQQQPHHNHDHHHLSQHHAGGAKELLAHLRQSETLSVVAGGICAMVAAYKRTLLADYGIDIGNEEDFVADIKDFIPIAAAVNICSNILHAATDLLLTPGNVPSATDLYLDRHQFNWLQHAANHCTLFHFNCEDGSAGSSGTTPAAVDAAVAAGSVVADGPAPSSDSPP